MASTCKHATGTRERLETGEILYIGKSKKGRNRKTSLSRTWFLFSAFINAMDDEKTVVDAAREAMKMASRSVGFLGSKGMFQR